MNSITRKELYGLIWSKPLREVSSKLNIKDTLIKGICQSYKIPLPILGHWSKLEFNKESPVFPFVEDDQIDNIIDLTNYINMPKVKPIQKEVEVKPIILDSKKEKLKIKLKDKELEVITETRKWLKEGYNYYKNYNENAQRVDVDVSPKLQERALDFLNKFLKYARVKEFSVSSSNLGTYIGLKNQSLRVRVRESYNRVKKPNAKIFDTEQKVPNGILILQLGEGYWKLEWRETETTKLLDKLDDILNRVEVKFLNEIDRENEILKEKIRQRELDKLVQAREELVSTHLSKFKLLLNQARKSSEVELLRRYLQRLKGIDNPTKECLDWIKWSEEAVDWYDPLINYDHPFLKDVDKDTLTVKQVRHTVENWYLEYSFKDYKYDNEWENYRRLEDDE